MGIKRTKDINCRFVGNCEYMQNNIVIVIHRILKLQNTLQAYSLMWEYICLPNTGKNYTWPCRITKPESESQSLYFSHIQILATLVCYTILYLRRLFSELRMSFPSCQQSIFMFITEKLLFLKRTKTDVR